MRKYGWPSLPIKRFKCTAVMAASADLPRSLDGATTAARVQHRKDPRGKRLVRQFCMPRKPTKNDSRTRVMPDDDPVAFDELLEYCAADVEAERALAKALPPLPASEWSNYWLNVFINENGIPLDMELLNAASKVTTELEGKIHARTLELTDGLKPTQRDKMISWFESQGVIMQNLQADTVRSSIKNLSLAPDVKELLELRIEASRASTKKIVSMRACANTDGRVRGGHLFYGAHSGRDSGRLIQPQNFIRGHSKPAIIDPIRDALRTGDAAWFRALFAPNPMETVASIMRSFIAADEGKMLYIVDYSQIEARVLDWLSNNVDGLARWRSGIDPYKLMAALIYDIPIEQVTDEQRRIGKNAVLGAGYSMSSNAFREYCAGLGITIDDETAELAIGTYREVNAPIVQYWADVEQCAKAAILSPGEVIKLRHVSFQMVKHWLTIKLPSGRRLWYPHARVTAQRTRYGKVRQTIEYTSPHGPRTTYGGKLVENIDQAISRDMLMTGMVNGYKAGFTPVMKVHDEGVFHDDEGKDLKVLERAMCTIPAWLDGCPIEAKGFVTKYYRKD